jgi:hypothetical protein
LRAGLAKERRELEDKLFRAEENRKRLEQMVMEERSRLEEERARALESAANLKATDRRAVSEVEGGDGEADSESERKATVVKR